LPLDSIEPNPVQPRDVFREDKLQELAESIKVHGVIQPVVVRKAGKGYQIIAGERRWRASKIAGLKEVPVVIQEVSDAELLEVALIENIQREDLNPIETALAYDRLSKELDLSQEEIGRRTGKDRASIANFIRLLRLPKPVRDLVADQRLSMGHAKALLTLSDGTQQSELGTRAAAGGWSVRQLEIDVRKLLGDDGSEPAAKKEPEKIDPNVKAAMDQLQTALGTRVRILPGPGGKRGKIEIEYYTPEELDRLYYLLVGDERRD
jgi:ParB family chromosome partitioning protein